MLELAETILRLTGSSSRLTFHPLPEDDPRQRQPDISMARKTLGGNQEFALRTAFQKR